MNLTYQLLALDPPEKTRCENAASLVYLILGFTKLWKKAKVSGDRITDGNTTLVVTAIEEAEDSTASPTDELGRAFILSLNGLYSDIEALREPLACFLKDQKFELLYVLKDEVSADIACKLYPHLYRVENLLRGYLIRFMATHIGPSWWELTASSEMADKAKKRKKNELIFGKHIENSAYLIDFDELGEIVYEQSSGLLTREDIVGRISDLAETPEAIRSLKQEMKSNYHKLFKESFADKKFKDKWEAFEDLRNKIAHNNLFTAEDLSKGERLAAEITAIISAADTEAQKLVITSEEREAVKEQVIARSSPVLEISEEAFLTELDSKLRSYTERRDGFVGLTKFVSHLGVRGYPYASSHGMMKRLSTAGLIEVYYVSNPFDGTKRTAAIRRASTLTTDERVG